MAKHTDIIEGELGGTTERFVGRIEIVDGVVTVSESRMNRLAELLLIPRFLPDGSACSMIDEPMRYLELLVEDLHEGLGLRATPLHDFATCAFRSSSGP